MKKFVSICICLFAFSLTSKAQSTLKPAVVKQEKVSAEDMKIANMKIISEITSVIKIDESFKNDLMSLFSMRDEALMNATNDNDRAMIYQRYGEKFLAGLSEEQRNTLKQKPELYQRITEYKPSK
ncbi:MAG: hypothetical protein ACOVQR_10230 [Flavobacterium sp.]|jgi:hypothetical protein|uniref:hypothetical protein n=1 Tax=Flavobacterium sp. TaxID=239 RepID=UPI003BA79983